MGYLTPFAGLWRLEDGDSISDNEYAFFENPDIVDAYLNFFVTHRHDGAEAVQPFDEPPVLEASAAGGSLLGGETWYVGITALDQFGGETTAVSASASTPGAVPDPSAAVGATVFNDGAGIMTAGTYRYAYTIVSGSGESTPSPVKNVTIMTNGRIRITPPGPPDEWRLYRSYGYGELNRIGSTLTASSFIDDGTETLYCDQLPPDENTTAQINSITVTRPDLPSGATAWRIYVAKDADLTTPALYQYDHEGLLTDIPASASVIIFDDDSFVTDGHPPDVSRTIPGAARIFADEVEYGGSGAIASGGTVEDALDYLVGRLGGSQVTSLNGASGALALYASGNASISVAGSGLLITVPYPSPGTTVHASGSTALSGDVTFVGSGAATVSQAGQIITIYAPASAVSTTIREEGEATLLDGDVQFAAGTGISIIQDTGGKKLTIATTGSGPASAGVNSVSVDGAGFLQGDIGLYAGAGVSLSYTGSAITISSPDDGAEVTSIAASGYSPMTGPVTLVGGSGMVITESAAASTITIEASGHVFRTVHTFAIAGEVKVAVGQTDYIPPFFVSKSPNQTVKLVKAFSRLNAGAASASVQINGSDHFANMHIDTTDRNTSSESAALAEGDKISLVVGTVDATPPENLTVTLVLQHEVHT